MRVAPPPSTVQSALDDAAALLRAVADRLNHLGGLGGLDGGEAEAEAAPLAPATELAPLTVPAHLMAARYPPGGRYTPHSDNGLDWVSRGGAGNDEAGAARGCA